METLSALMPTLVVCILGLLADFVAMTVSSEWKAATVQSLPLRISLWMFAGLTDFLLWGVWVFVLVNTEDEDLPRPLTTIKSAALRAGTHLRRAYRRAKKTQEIVIAFLYRSDVNMLRYVAMAIILVPWFFVIAPGLSAWLGWIFGDEGARDFNTHAVLFSLVLGGALTTLALIGILLIDGSESTGEESGEKASGEMDIIDELVYTLVPAATFAAVSTMMGAPLGFIIVLLWAWALHITAQGMRRSNAG